MQSPLSNTFFFPVFERPERHTGIAHILYGDGNASFFLLNTSQRNKNNKTIIKINI